MSEEPTRSTPEAGPPATPRWVLALGIGLLILAALVVASQLAGIEHGPGRHSGAGHSAPLKPLSADFK